jgi:hypothetical protein
MNMHAGEKSDEGIVLMKGSRMWGQVLHYNIALLDRGGGLECGNARPDPKHLILTPSIIYQASFLLSVSAAAPLLSGRGAFLCWNSLQLSFREIPSENLAHYGNMAAPYTSNVHRTRTT